MSLSSSLAGGFELTLVLPTYNEGQNIASVIGDVAAALPDVRWQVIVVDDNSPDGTADAAKALAQSDPRISCLRRIGRRGLSGAVIEGALASAAPVIAVMDADGQHDETLLRQMYAAVTRGRADVVIASRYVGDGEAEGGFSATRALGSRLANQMAQKVLGRAVADPMSGFFMLRREIFDAAAPQLSADGFKILFDVLSAAPSSATVLELPMKFRARREGESKLSSRVVIDYLSLLASRATKGWMSPRAVLYGLVGLSGIAVQVAVALMLPTEGHHIRILMSAVVAMLTNFWLNNEITYGDRRLKGLALVFGSLKYMVFCGLGLAINLGVANVSQDVFTLLEQRHLLMLAPEASAWSSLLIGAVSGAVWNYSSTAAKVW